MNDERAAPALTTFGDLMESLDIVRGILQMPLEISRPESSHKRLGSGKLQSSTSKPDFAPPARPNSSPLLTVKPVEPVSF